MHHMPVFTCVVAKTGLELLIVLPPDKGLDMGVHHHAWLLVAFESVFSFFLEAVGP